MSNLVTACERVVQNHQCETHQGVLIDAMTANVIVTVAAALSPESRARIDELIERPGGLVRFVDFCWKHVK